MIIDKEQKGYLRYHKLIGLLIGIGLAIVGTGCVILAFGNWMIFGFGFLLQLCAFYQFGQVRKIWNKKIKGWKQ